MEAATQHAHARPESPRRSRASDPDWLSALEPVALRATQAAALACQRWIGRGDPHAADEAATESMRSVLAQAPGLGAVVVGEGAKDEAPEVNLHRAGTALGRSVDELRVVVLDKPRHQELIGRLPEAGASVTSPTDGDIAGALAVLLPEGEADLLMGVGGTTVPGIAFLSGGQSDELAAAHLNAINQVRDGPWELTFSFGRALQATALKLWAGNESGAAAAQAALADRARCNGDARLGRLGATLDESLAS